MPLAIGAVKFNQKEVVQTVVHDTVPVPSKIQPVIQSSTQSQPTDSKKKIVDNTITQKNRQGDNEANQNSGINKGNMGGSNNKSYTVEGDNNGINGDVNINTERYLTEKDKIDFIKNIESFKKENNITSNCLHLNKTPACNAGRFYTEAIEYLRSKGYSIERMGTAYLDPAVPLNGINLNVYNNCVEITIGTL